jgi:hypothetical protein
MYVAAFTYDGNGNESIKVVQPIQNGGVSGSPGTVTAFHLAYAVASDGTPTVTAVVNPSTTSVKFAADTADFPDDATVRAATPDSSVPFQATFGTLTAGEALYVAAFAYDANGNESPKALLTILVDNSTPGVTPGSGSGSASPFGACFDGNGFALTLTGTTKVNVGPMSGSGTISKVAVIPDASGTVTFGVKKCARSGYPASLADITGGNDVTLSTTSLEDSTLTGWSTSWSADDVFQIELKAVDGVVKQATLLLYP